MNKFLILCILYLPCIMGMISILKNLFSTKSLDTLLEESSPKLIRIDKKGDMMLHKFIRNKNVDNVKKLMKPKFGINHVNKYGSSPLHLAVIAGEANIVDELIKANAKLSLKTRVGGNTPLHLAAERGLHEILEKLIKAGAEMDAKNAWRYTALHLGAKHGFVTVVQTLLSHGAMKDEQSPGRTALHEAVLFGSVEVVKILLSRGFNIEKVGNDYNLRLRTPLQMAVKNLNVEMVRILLDSGANPNGYVSVKTPLFYLAQHSKLSPQYTENLVRREALEFELESKERMKMKSILDLLLHYKADVKIENYHAYNVLGYAIKNNYVVTFEILMEKIKEEIASGVPGDWTKVLEAEGMKDYPKRGLQAFPDTNTKNALDLSLAMQPINISIAFPLIRLEAYRRRSEFKMEGLAVASILNQFFLRDYLDTMADKARNLMVKTFEEFWDISLEYFSCLRSKNVPRKRTLDAETDPFSKYADYKENNIYIYYLAIKQYYPYYRLQFNPKHGIDNGLEEVAEFENIIIMPYKVKIGDYVGQIASEMSIIQRLDLEEKFVLLSIVIRESLCDLRDAESVIRKAIESA